MSMFILSSGQQIQVLSKNKYSCTLQANIEQNVTVPTFSAMGISPNSGQKFIMDVVVPYNGTVSLAVNQTSEVANTSMDTTTSELVTGSSERYRRVVKAGDLISLITTDTSCVVFIEYRFYS